MMSLKALFVLSFLFSIAFSKFTGVSDTFTSGPVFSERLTQNQGKDGFFTDLPTTFYSVNSLNLLKKTVPKASSICETLKKNLSSYSSAADLHFALTLLKSLNCKSTDAESLEKVRKLLSSSSIKDLYHAISTLVTLDAASKESAQIQTAAKRILELREEDGSFRPNNEATEGTSLDAGLALQTLSLAYPLVKEDTKTDINQLVFEIENLFGRATSKNNYLAFVDDNADPQITVEATSRVFQGVDALGGVVSKKIDLSQEQVGKLTEFFIQNQHVNEAHDIYFVLVGINTASTNRFFQPLVSSIVSETLVVKGSESSIKIKVTDINGNFATPAKLVISSIAPFNAPKAPIVKGQELFAEDKDESKNTVYHFNFLALKPEPGLYTVSYTVNPSKKNFISPTAEGAVKVVTAVSLYDCVVQTSDSSDQDQKLAETNKYSCDKPIDDVIRNIYTKYVRVSFKLRNQATGKALQAHQAFVRMGNSEQEQIYVPKLGDKSTYSAFLNLSTSSVGKLGLFPGKYALELIVGDSFIQKPTTYPLISVALSSDAKPTQNRLAPKPEISHLFRQPEKRPPATFSLAFTAIVLSPALFLFVGLIKVGANIRNFPLGISFLPAVGFQVSLGFLLFVFFLFWLVLDMFQALTYLAIVSLPTIFFGQKTLLALSAARNARK